MVQAAAVRRPGAVRDDVQRFPRRIVTELTFLHPLREIAFPTAARVVGRQRLHATRIHTSDVVTFGISRRGVPMSIDVRLSANSRLYDEII